MHQTHLESFPQPEFLIQNVQDDTDAAGPGTTLRDSVFSLKDPYHVSEYPTFSNNLSRGPRDGLWD